jgi:hypothetical protein
MTDALLHAPTEQPKYAHAPDGENVLCNRRKHGAGHAYASCVLFSPWTQLADPDPRASARRAGHTGNTPAPPGVLS